MKAIVGNPDCWQYVKLTVNGQKNSQGKKVFTMKDAGNKIKPFLLPPQLAPFNRATCSA
jgi:hypothetical protein